MSNLPTLSGCGQPATIRIEIYSAANGQLHGSLDGSVHACDAHGIEMVSAIQASGFTAHRMSGGDVKRCGDGLDFTGTTPRTLTAPTPAEVPAAPEPPEHPAWCIKGRICTQDGIHHSRPLTANSGDAHDAIRLWLERAWSLTNPSIVLESTVDGEVSYSYLPLGQARVLRHQLGRLIDAAKGGAL